MLILLLLLLLFIIVVIDRDDGYSVGSTLPPTTLQTKVRELWMWMYENHIGELRIKT